MIWLCCSGFTRIAPRRETRRPRDTTGFGATVSELDDDLARLRFRRLVNCTLARRRMMASPADGGATTLLANDAESSIPRAYKRMAAWAADNGGALPPRISYSCCVHPR